MSKLPLPHLIAWLPAPGELLDCYRHWQPPIGFLREAWGTNGVARRVGPTTWPEKVKMGRLVQNRWKKKREREKKAEALEGQRDPQRWREGGWHAAPDCRLRDILLIVNIQRIVQLFWTVFTLNFGSLVSSVLPSTRLNIIRYWSSGIVGQVGIRHPWKCPWYLHFKVWRIRITDASETWAKCKLSILLVT